MSTTDRRWLEWVVLTALAGAAASGCRPAAPVPRGKDGEPEPTTPLLEKGDVQLELGVRGHHRDGTWTFLRARVKNRGLAFRGSLEVRGILESDAQGVPRFDAVSYTLPLEIPRGGPPRQVWIPVRPQGWVGVQATFEQPGYSRRHVLDLTPGAADRAAMLLVGPRLPNADRLAAALEGRFRTLETRDNELVTTSEHDIPGIELVTTVEEDLPPLAAGYDAFDLVVLHGTGLAHAPADAVEALARWVEAGGTLAAFPGTDWAGALPARLRELLGVDPAPGGSLPAAVRSRAGGAAQPGMELPLMPRAGTVEIEPGLAYRSRRGAGSVTAFAFAPTGDQMPAGRSAEGLVEPLRDALARGVEVTAAARHLDGAADRARRVLEKLTAFLVPERRDVVSGLALYLALGFLVPGWLFRRLGRPWWTFAWIAAAAAGSTWFVWRHGLITASGVTELNEVTYLRPHPDGRTMEATSFVGCFSPSAARVDFWEDARDDEAHPLRDARAWILDERARHTADWMAALLGEEVSHVADRAGRLRLEPVRLRPNVLRRLRFDYRVAIDPQLFAPGREAPPGDRDLAACVPPEISRLYRARLTRGSVFPGAPGIAARQGILVLLEEERDGSRER